MDELTAFLCQCQKWPPIPCQERMTQEDLRCDACRGGRCILVGVVGQPVAMHAMITDWKVSLKR